MENILRLGAALGAGKTKTQEHIRQAERCRLISDIRDASLRLVQIRQNFDLVSDPDLIEAAIFEERAMEARRRHLMRRAKEMGITCQPY